MLLLLLFVVGLLFQHTSGASYACSPEKNACGCSYRPVITTKIIGGEAAQSHSWGWMASLRLSDQHFCGGTILNEWFVITAAHCVADRLTILSNMSVCVGIDYLSDICSQNLSVANITIHHGFSNRTTENDIALLRVATPLNFSDLFIARICLPNMTHSLDYPDTGTAVVIVGWGSAQMDGTATNELQQATLKIIDRSARMCASNSFNSRLQLCGYSPEKDACQGDSGGPLMLFTASKQWELVGVTSYGRACASHEYAGSYTRLTTYQEFIASVMNGTYTIPASRKCSCQCPYGRNQGSAYTTENSPEACVHACRGVSTNLCNSFNTYACLGTDCVYSAAYIYNCSCQCPFASKRTFAYITGNSTEACVNVCIAIPSNNCIRSNTYACLEDNCTYSNSYDNSSVEVPSRYQCSCQCPYGSTETFVLSKVNTTEACLYVCILVSSTNCLISNTYACLGTSCAYSSGYVNSSSPQLDSYKCSCQCPYGSDQGGAITSINSTEACIDACRAVLTNRCTMSNTYACLGTSCAYSSEYENSSSPETDLYRCSCQCPYGSSPASAYTSINSAEACLSACILAPFNPCNNYNTYACLNTDCVYSRYYVRNCSCQCPFGSNVTFAYTFENSTDACVNACIAFPSNDCIHSNTYACLEDNCTYSSSYDNTSILVPVRYECSCQCPYGSNKSSAFAKENSSEACVAACRALSSNTCDYYNTYACLGTTCAYSGGYIHSSSTAATSYRCSCQCPRGSDQGWVYTNINSADACVSACRAVPSNDCVISNTYACLGTSCAYSTEYNYSSSTETDSYRCSCECPRGSDEGWASTNINSADACVSACGAVTTNRCTMSNTYACLGTSCTYSSSYVSSTSTAAGSYRCSCQCPYGSDQGWTYTNIYSADACVSACRAVPSNDCLISNTYACLGTSCAYSTEYNYSSSTETDSYRCSCECPRGSDEGWASTNINSADACVSACRAVPTNQCTMSNTYACLGTSCAYSSGYSYLSSTAVRFYRCSCQCPYGSDQGSVYININSADACVYACRAVLSNDCLISNTYACLGTNCAYSSLYMNSSTAVSGSYRCSCQCPYGSDQGFAFTNINSSETCVNACIAVPSNNCFHSNTYVCLEDNCTYSSSYDNSSVTTVPARYRCACYCPHGSYRGVALSKMNRTEACVNACIAVPSNPCLRLNTYACLGNNCVYSSSYSHVSIPTPVRYRCSCQCPYGYLQGLAYTTQNSVEACIDACQAVKTNPCVSSNTYACLGTNCAYSSSYNNISRTLPSGYRCTCQCPFGSDQAFAYAEANSTVACVNACKAVPWNSCDSSNTYACLGTDCIYSNSYIH